MLRFTKDWQSSVQTVGFRVNFRYATSLIPALPEVKTNPFLKFFMYFTGPISYLLEIAVIISGVLKDWVDFGILVFVLIVNAVIGFHEEAKAESALDALKNTLALKSKVMRNGALVEVEAALLVPGLICIYH